MHVKDILPPRSSRIELRYIHLYYLHIITNPRYNRIRSHGVKRRKADRLEYREAHPPQWLDTGRLVGPIRSSALPHFLVLCLSEVMVPWSVRIPALPRFPYDKICQPRGKILLAPAGNPSHAIITF